MIQLDRMQCVLQLENVKLIGEFSAVANLVHSTGRRDSGVHDGIRPRGWNCALATSWRALSCSGEVKFGEFRHCH